MPGQLTVTVERIAAAAMAAGLNPCTRVQSYRGAREMYLDAHAGPDSPFGVVRIGARTGRVLSAWLKAGNDGPKTIYPTGQACAAALRRLHPAAWRCNTAA